MSAIPGGGGKMVRFASFVSSLAAALLFAAHAHAACDDRPTFSSEYNPVALPELPRDASSREAVEAFRLSLETFRAQSIEGFNDAIKDYITKLNRIDNTARKRTADGQCTVDEYQALRDYLDDEFQKSGDEYLSPYWRGIAAYRKQIDWCKQRDEDLKDIGKMV